MRCLTTIVIPVFASVVAMQVVSTGALQAQGSGNDAHRVLFGHR